MIIINSVVKDETMSKNRKRIAEGIEIAGDVGKLIKSKEHITNVCVEAIRNPSAESSQRVRDELDIYRRDLAKSATTWPFGWLFSGFLGQLIDNENIRDYIQGSKEDNDHYNSFMTVLRGDQWYVDRIVDACALEGIDLMYRSIGHIESERIFYIDPLMIDLDGNGLDLSNTAYFDHDGDGILNRTNWVSTGDGFLVFDKNGNGKIDNGSELFGDNYIKQNGKTAIDGFDALTDLDSNHDGLFNHNDTHFDQVNVW